MSLPVGVLIFKHTILCLEQKRLGALLSLLRGLAPAERVAALDVYSQPGSFERTLLSEIRGAPAEDALVLAVNEHLGDFASALEDGERWGAVLARICGLAGAALACLQVASHTAWSVVLSTTAITLAGVLISFDIRRRGASKRKMLRATVDELVDLLFGQARGVGALPPRDTGGPLGPAKASRVGRNKSRR